MTKFKVHGQIKTGNTIRKTNPTKKVRSGAPEDWAYSALNTAPVVNPSSQIQCIQLG